MTANRSIRRCARCEKVRTHRARGLCKPCYATAYRNGTLIDYARTNRPREEVVEEVAFLLPTRGAESTAAALGMTPAAIARACCRAGRPDLARPFWPLAWAAP